MAPSIFSDSTRHCIDPSRRRGRDMDAILQGFICVHPAHTEVGMIHNFLFQLGGQSHQRQKTENSTKRRTMAITKTLLVNIAQNLL